MASKVDYFEIGTTDVKKTKAFYGGLFGWNIKQGNLPSYNMVNGEEGGIWDTSDMGGAEYAIFYVHVDDVAAALKKAEELGAKVVLPLTDNGAITFAHLTDPQGNRFGVWRPNQ